MRRIIVTIATAIILFFVTAKGQSLDSFFEKYANDDRFESVTVNKTMINFAKFTGNADREEKEMMKNIKAVRVLTSKVSPDSVFQSAFLNEVKSMIAQNQLENLLEVRDKGDHVSVFGKSQDQIYTDLLILVKEPDGLNLVWITGKIKPETIDQLKNKEIHS